MSKKIRTLTIYGAGLLIAGTALVWSAEPLSGKKFNVSENGYLSKVDEDWKQRIDFVGDKVSLLGIALLVVGSAGWMIQREGE